MTAFLFLVLDKQSGQRPCHLEGKVVRKQIGALKTEKRTNETGTSLTQKLSFEQRGRPSGAQV